jgi:hypothetical protein
MKTPILIFLSLFTVTTAFAQPYKKPGTVNLNSGYANVNELTAGYGLRVTSEDYSKYFVGFTTTHGYQLNLFGLNVKSNLFGGLAAGALFYNGGLLIPLYGDLRFTWNRKKFTPFLFGRSGLLLNPDDIDLGTRQFINLGGGLKLKLNEQFTASISPGILIQMGNLVPRDAFVDIKVGLYFKAK